MAASLNPTASTHSVADRWFRGLTVAAAAFLVLLLLAILLQLGRAALGALQVFGPVLLTGRTWDPAGATFGILPFVYGTVLTSLLALLIAAPVALGVAVYLAELAPEGAKAPVTVAVELLAAVPSIVYGLWGVFVLVPWLRDTVQPQLQTWLGFLPVFSGASIGFGVLAASLVLAVMILPTLAAISRDVLLAIPRAQREAALALGATRFEMIRDAVLPQALPGIVGAMMLGLGRALGETMAVTMVIGNRADISLSWFAPAQTMASLLANEYAEATEELHLGALAFVGLSLFAVTLLLNLGARGLVRRVAGSAARSPGGAR